jgi:hypothetical protein
MKRACQSGASWSCSTSSSPVGPEQVVELDDAVSQLVHGQAEQQVSAERR